MNSNNITYNINIKKFKNIPGLPIAYWASSNIFEIFKNKPLEESAFSCKGLDTCDNDRFVRCWFEVNFFKIGFNLKKLEETYYYKWFPYCKGGNYRRWYGNLEMVVLWENDGEVLRNLRDENGKIKSRPQNTKYYFKKGLTFNSISSNSRAIRYMDNCIFGGGGCGLFADDDIKLFNILALINSNVSAALFKYMNSGFNFLVGDLLKIPFIEKVNENTVVLEISKQNIDISRKDWDSFETSWDFKKHPLI